MSRGACSTPRSHRRPEQSSTKRRWRRLGSSSSNPPGATTSPSQPRLISPTSFASPRHRHLGPLRPRPWPRFPQLPCTSRKNRPRSSQRWSSASKPISAASSFWPFRIGTSAATDRQRAGHPARHARAGDGAALGGREGEPVLPARLRRRSRHGSGPLHRRHSHQHGLARAWPGLRRHELHHPRGRGARGDHQGSLFRRPGRLRDGRRRQHGVARRLRAHLGGCRVRRIRPTTGLPDIGRWPSPAPSSKASRPPSRPRSGARTVPFDNPENWDKYKLFNKLTLSSPPTSTLSFGEMSYAGNWHGSGQIPARAVEEGLISRFGSIDPDEGGNTARHQLFASCIAFTPPRPAS
jgi:hypothetical protein